MNRSNHAAEATQLVLIAAMFGTAAVSWPLLGDRIPIHWNLQGEVDRYGGKFIGLLALPILTAALYVLLRVLPRFDPGRANYDSFQNAYSIIRLSITAVMALVDCLILLVAFGRDVNVSAMMLISVGLLFVVLGNVMGKIRPNWFVGVRTPWTLSSHRSWNKTHRLAGWLFVLLGVVTTFCGFVQNRWTFAIAISLGGLVITWTIIYSYLVWRTDPDRVSPAGTSPAVNDQEPR